MALDADAELIGWDVTALGLPNANLPFARGQFLQHIEMPKLWFERGLVKAGDARLLDSPLGFAGRRCLASIFLLTGSPMARAQKEKAQELARDLARNHSLMESIGVTSPNPQVIVARVLSPMVEPAMDILRQIRAAWRTEIWGLPNDHAPRIWAT
jgi:urease accessory protein